MQWNSYSLLLMHSNLQKHSLILCMSLESNNCNKYAHDDDYDDYDDDDNNDNIDDVREKKVCLFVFKAGK